MQAMERLGTIVPPPLGIPLDTEADELVGWDLPADFAVASTDEIEGDLALGHPAWGSLMRVTE